MTREVFCEGCGQSLFLWAVCSHKSVRIPPWGKVGPEVKKETATDSHQYSFSFGSMKPFCTSLLWNATNDFYIATTFPLFSISSYALLHLVLLTPFKLRKLSYEMSVLCTRHKPGCPSPSDLVLAF